MPTSDSIKNELGNREPDTPILRRVVAQQLPDRNMCELPDDLGLHLALRGYLWRPEYAGGAMYQFTAAPDRATTLSKAGAQFVRSFPINRPFDNFQPTVVGSHRRCS